MSDYVLSDPSKLIFDVSEMLSRVNVPRADARIVSDCLVTADLMGIKSHGVQRMKLYMDGIAQGGTTAECKMELRSDFPAGALYNAKGALGIVAAHRAMSTAMEKARSVGVGVTAVYNSNHCGTMRYYTDMAAESGMIGFACSNAACMMVPFGSREPFLGTNPLAVSVPSGTDPVTLDMATSVVARGKIILAQKNGQSIPEGWAIDKNGCPTTDPSAALEGYVLPFGGPKGSGLSMAADILCGVLAGGAYGPHINYPYAHPELPMDCGHFFAVIDIDRFRPLAEFLSGMDMYRMELKSLKPAPGVTEVRMPGEAAAAKRRANESNGIELSLSVYEELAELARRVGMTLSFMK